MTTYFNEGIQIDMVVVDDGTIVHLICICIKWAQGIFVDSNEATHVLPAIVQAWFRIYGPPKFMVAGALFSDEGAIWADRWKVPLKPKSSQAHANFEGRRTDILRKQYNKLRS